MANLAVAGIDWATKPKNRALVILRWNAGTITLEEVNKKLTDIVLAEMLASSAYSIVTVDIPFGWPIEFSTFVNDWSLYSVTQSPPPPRETFRYRTTDLVVIKELGTHPLSVSSDKIALGARLWASVVAKKKLWKRIDVGRYKERPSSPIIEVYPKATLQALNKNDPGVKVTGYKKSKGIPDTNPKYISPETALSNRRDLIERLGDRFEMAIDDDKKTKVVGTLNETHEIDAFLAALTGFMYLGVIEGWTVRKPHSGSEQKAASREGWIYFPMLVQIQTS